MKFFSQEHSGFARVPSADDFARISFAEFGKGMRFSTRCNSRRIHAAPFRSHVSKVAGASVVEQVAWVAARRVVAGMASALRGPLALHQKPSHAMRQTGAFAVPPDAVSPVVFGAQPDPARTKIWPDNWPVLVDVRPEPSDDFVGHHAPTPRRQLDNGSVKG